MKLSLFFVAILAISSNFFLFTFNWYVFAIAVLVCVFICYKYFKRWYAIFLILPSIIHFSFTHFHSTIETNKQFVKTFQVGKCAINYCLLKYDHKSYYLNIKEENYLQKNDLVEIKGYVELIKPAENFYQFDMKGYLNTLGVTKQIHLNESIKSISKSNSIFVNFKNWLTDNKTTNAMIELLFFQNKTEQNKQLYQQFVDMSIVHLLVISGFHINLIALLLIKILNLLRVKKLAQPITISIICIYLLMLGFPLTAVRSWIVLLLNYLNHRFFKSKVSAISIWSICLLSIISINPYSFLQRGIIYGFLITLTLTLLRNKIKHLSYIKQFIMISFLIFPITAGLNVYYNYSINLTSILFNFLLTPLINLIYIINFMIILIKPLHFIYYYVYLIINNCTRLLGKINFNWNTGYINQWIIMLYYGLFYTLFLVDFKRIKWFGFATVNLVMTTFNLLAMPLYTINMLNVGNANAILITDKLHFSNILYDVGSGQGYSKSTVYDYLKYRGINWINGIIISHYHQDHYDNLPIVKEKIPIFNYVDNSYGEDILRLASFEFKVFNNNQNHYSDENDNSLVLGFKINGYNILLTGDMTKVIETEVVNKIGKIDFLQVAHHGSKTSSTIEFLDKIKPNYCLISGKKDHRFNFPDQQTINNLKMVNCNVYQTFKLKNISVNFFKSSFSISSL